MPSKRHRSSSTSKNHNLLAAIIVIIAGLVIGTGLYKLSQPDYTFTDVVIGPNPTPVPTVASYNCSDGKTIQATFSGDNVNLVLSDGRKLSLPHAISADGARFANANESIVFWNVGNTAFIEENGVQTYANCVQA